MTDSSAKAWSVVVAGVLCALFAGTPAEARQGYEAARVPIRAVLRGEVQLRVEPSAGARTIGRPDGEVTVLGRRQGWFEVEGGDPKRLKGWVASGDVRLLGPVTPPPPVETAKPVTRTRVAAPVFLSLYAGLSYGAKLMPGQIRFGMSLFRGAGSSLRFGGSAEVGFREIFTFAAVPSVGFEPKWPRFGRLRPFIYAGVPFYVTVNDGERDLLSGLRFGGEVRYAPRSLARSGMALFISAFADAMIFGSQRVAVPITGVAGLERRF